MPRVRRLGDVCIIDRLQPGQGALCACCCEKVWPEGDLFEEYGGRACMKCAKGDCAIGLAKATQHAS